MFDIVGDEILSSARHDKTQLNVVIIALLTIAQVAHNNNRYSGVIDYKRCLVIGAYQTVNSISLFR